MLKKSLHELALNSKKALLIGIGGGGDIIQGIPIKNYFKLLGVEEVYLAGVAGEWWPFDTSTPSEYIWAPTAYLVEDLDNAQLVCPGAARVNKDTTYKGRSIAEAKVAQVLEEDTYVFGVRGGVQGLLKSFNEFIDKMGIDMVVGMDIGSDSLYSGEDEVHQPKTPLVDFIVLSALSKLKVNSVYGLAGLGCDGEMEIVDVERNISKIMKAGGFISAYGLTQKDIAEMEKACELFPDPVEKFPCLAAKGDFTYKNMKLMDVWGATVKIMPITAVTLFFDPAVVVESCARYAAEIYETNSLEEAEDIFLSLGVVPETRLPRTVDFLPPKK